MPTVARIAMYCVLATLTGAQTGCNLVPRSHLAQSQLRTRQLYEQNRALAIERERTAQGLAGENQRMQQQLADLQAARDTLQQRVDNLLNERQELQTRLASNRTSPLSGATTREFEELVRKYPNAFEFDPNTGVSKFNSDILFESGSAELRSGAEPVLREFVQILNSGDAQALNILVVGHTDDRRVSKPATRAKHPDNWYLSAHRAITITHALARLGLRESRMGVAGYGPHQPLAANRDDKARQRNRRVEIFVLAPNASVAGRDSGLEAQ